VKKGLVIKSTGSWYYVKDKDGNVVPCKIKGTYRIRGIRATNPVAVGDQVDFDLTDSGNGIISHIDDRKNYIIRRSANLSKEYQLIAANVDQAVLMISLVNPKTHLAFIDRFLVSAEAFRIPVILLFNKTDIYSEEETSEMKQLAACYREIGYPAISVSVKEGTNMDRAAQLFADKVSVVAGNSGVGKTTLLNHLDPSLNLKTREVSLYHKSGQHTTTYAEMFFLPGNARIVDTPGIKGFGMVDIERAELFHFFPEIFRYSKDCKFHNCMHVNEPECAVIKAVNDNKMMVSRYINYLNLLEDMGDKYRK
jgi:ribosome biogenesis GTPase